MVIFCSGTTTKGLPCRKPVRKEGDFCVYHIPSSQRVRKCATPKCSEPVSGSGDYCLLHATHPDPEDILRCSFFSATGSRCQKRATFFTGRKGMCSDHFLSRECTGVDAAGHRCTKSALPGISTCAEHTPPDRCEHRSSCGTRCRLFARPGFKTCADHDDYPDSGFEDEFNFKPPPPPPPPIRLSPLKVLGISAADATDRGVRHAYLEKCRISHPDKGGAEGEFAKVQWAYALLRTGPFRLRVVAGDYPDYPSTRGFDDT